MKKKLASVGCLAMSAVLLAGCGASSAPSGSNSVTSGDKKEPVTITAMVMQSRNYDGLQAMIQKLKEEENITIDCQVVPDDQYENLMKMKFNSGEAPDIVDYNITEIFPKIDPEQFLYDLSDESWVPNLISADGVTYNGKVYGFPFQSLQGLYGFTYNKDAFETAGITQEPTTWEELLEVCEKLKQAGITPIHEPKDSWVPQIMVGVNFGAAIGMDKAAEFAEKVQKNEAKWTDYPEFATVVDTYIDLFKNGYVNSDSMSATYDDTIAAVGSGTAAMHYNGDFFANSVKEAYPDANLGMFNVYMPGAKTDNLQGNTAPVGFVASKNSPNIETVKRVFELWSTPEYANLYFENRPGFPAFEGVDGGATPDYLVGLKENYVDQAKFSPEFNLGFSTGKSAMEEYLWIYLISAPVKGDMDGAQMMAQFDQDFTDFMKESKQPGF